ncbi:trypsin-like peptidase domain-containing protein [Candidatus Saccharibacteria bacterium]|nr:trypsin-like peptidase domain-containing protein [Candidatus Saccharibacteria bacterium]
MNDEKPKDEQQTYDTSEDLESATAKITPTEQTAVEKLRAMMAGLLVSTLFFGFVAGFFGAVIANVFFQQPIKKSVEKSTLVFDDESKAISGVAEKVGPSVVSIVSEVSGPLGRLGQGAGSGIVLEDGLILTNRHVIDGAGDSITIISSEGKKYSDVSILAKDSVNDIAFLKSESAKELPAARLGNSSDVIVGQRVVAIGNALGQFDNSVTSGIISGKGRPITAGGQGSQTEQLVNLFQTDAAINPGNSGGPLVALDGTVIGMNTAVAGDAENIGFAIPSNDIKPLVKTVSSEGRIIRPFLGVRYILLTPETINQLDLGVENGALLQTIEGGSGIVNGGPADEAGLKSGDVITEINGQKVDRNNSLITVVSQHAPGDIVTVGFMRDSKSQTTKVTLGEAPNN